MNGNNWSLYRLIPHTEKLSVTEMEKAMKYSTTAVKQHVKETNRALGGFRKCNGQLFKSVEKAYFALKDSKAELKEYKKNVDCDRSSINKIIAIVCNDTIMKLLDMLPTSWGSLYSLTKIDDDELIDLIEKGKLHKKITLDEIRILREGLEAKSTDESDSTVSDKTSEDDSSTGDDKVSEEYYPVNTLIVDRSKFTKIQYKRIRNLLDQLQKEGFEIRYLDKVEMSDAA